MLILFIVLAALSLVAMIAGIVWTVTVGGEVKTRRGTDVGAEVIADRMLDEPGEHLSATPRTAFKGKAVSVEAGAELSLGELKALVRGGHWSHAAPVLLAIGGMFGLMLFGALAFFVGVDNKLVGGIAVVVVLYACLRILMALARA